MMFKETIYKWYKKICDLIIHITRTIQYYASSNRIIVNAWIDVDLFNYNHRNFGDDINVPLIEKLTNHKVSIKNSLWTRKPNLLCIGSIIDKLGDNNSIIWGAGVLDGNSTIHYKPHKVCAVRGRYSRNYLIGFGIDCPEIYGDPALLFPLIYHPIIEKKYKIGIIPHYSDLNSPIVNEFVDNNKDEVTLIKFANYHSWEDVINKICSCESIVSSSLHGLIISDAYGIPNVRIKLSNKIGGGDFKYKDYFSGVNRKWEQPIDCFTEISKALIDKAVQKYQPINYNCEALLASFPFDIPFVFESDNKWVGLKQIDVK